MNTLWEVLELRLLLCFKVRPMSESTMAMRETWNINSVLPVEMLERIFGLLRPWDLKAVVAVCRR